MKKYLTEKDFRDFILGLKCDTITRLKCEADGYIATLSFNKVLVEICENEPLYPVVIYTFPQTRDAGLIQEDIDNGWDENIRDVWNDITDQCGFKPFFE